MSLPICPVCKSGNVASGYPIENGKSKCGSCGHFAAVAAFHTPAASPVYDRRTKPFTASAKALRSPAPPVVTAEPEPGNRYWWQDA